MKYLPQFSTRTFLITLAILVIAIIISRLSGNALYTGIPAITALTLLAVYFYNNPKLKQFAFTIWVFVFVVSALFYPVLFDNWGGFDLAILIVPLIQLIMFGMGTTLNTSDFMRVFKMPRPVIIGMLLQFTVMPLIAVLITSLFSFDSEVSAGIILIGSCPGGVASNLMAYLAGGNVALSVTMTSCSTLASPVMTPFLMESFAGKYVPIDFLAMMTSIFNMIIVPIVAGIFANRILYSASAWLKESRWLLFIACITLLISGGLILIDSSSFGIFAPLKSGLVIGFALISAVAFAKFVINNLLGKSGNWMDKVLPVVSMFGICFIIGIITSRSSEKLLSIGFALLAASIIHNLAGYVIGYWAARLSKLGEKSSRTVAFEVGMQNGGMATGLAMNVLKSASAALPPAIFGPWMNVSGSVLASWWKRKEIKEPGKST